jgi:Domain of unknown function (DUF1902)
MSALAHFRIQADWDPEARVWVATSDDVPGLATESSTLESLAEKLRALVPELLAANGLLPTETFSLELVSRREEEIRLAS